MIRPGATVPSRPRTWTAWPPASYRGRPPQGERSEGPGWAAPSGARRPDLAPPGCRECPLRSWPHLRIEDANPGSSPANLMAGPAEVHGFLARHPPLRCGEAVRARAERRSSRVPGARAPATGPQDHRTTVPRTADAAAAGKELVRPAFPCRPDAARCRRPPARPVRRPRSPSAFVPGGDGGGRRRGALPRT